jgi:hypothetical protein
VNEANRMKTEMGIGSAFNQARRLLDRVGKPDVPYWDTEEFTARLVVLDHAKPERHGIERTSGKSFVSNRLQIREWK